MDTTGMSSPFVNAMNASLNCLTYIALEVFGTERPANSSTGRNARSSWSPGRLHSEHAKRAEQEGWLLGLPDGVLMAWETRRASRSTHFDCGGVLLAQNTVVLYSIDSREFDMRHARLRYTYTPSPLHLPRWMRRVWSWL
jgi:hypothetical protein